MTPDLLSDCADKLREIRIMDRKIIRRGAMVADVQVIIVNTNAFSSRLVDNYHIVILNGK